MRLIDAANDYVRSRRATGSPFVSGEVVLRSLCKHCGDIAIQDLTGEAASRFINHPDCAPATRLSRFSTVQRFLDYLASRAGVPTVRLAKPRRAPTERVPFIFTQDQLRALLGATVHCQKRSSAMTGDALRVVFLFLYATGCSLAEVLSLRWDAVDLARKTVAFKRAAYGSVRTIPVGRQLTRIIKQYRQTSGIYSSKGLVFPMRDGTEIRQGYLQSRFQRLLKIADIRQDLQGRTARIQDLRFTFAVHRLSSWIEAGVDLNVRVPALSTYMGYASLTQAEQFLAHAPGRFRKDLRKLSPIQPTLRWKDDPIRMAALDSL